MKLFKCCSFGLIICLFTFSCSHTRKISETKNTKFSNLTQKLIEKVKSQNSNLFFDEKEKEEFLIKEKASFFVNGIIKVSKEINNSSIYELGIEVRSKIGQIWTISIPIHSILLLEQVEGIEYFEIDSKVNFKK